MSQRASGAVGLRASLEHFASGSRAERTAAAGVLQAVLTQFARQIAPTSDPEDVVQEHLAALLQQCLGGVPSSWPHADDTLRAFLRKSVRNRIYTSYKKAKREVTLEPAQEEERAASAVEAGLSARAATQAADQERQNLGTGYLSRALQLLPALVRAVIIARQPRFRDQAVETWNAMVEVYAGADLDALIAGGGREPSKAERERWYTRFKNLRRELLQQVEVSALPPDERELVAMFVNECLTNRGDLSDLRTLRITSGWEEQS